MAFNSFSAWKDLIMPNVGLYQTHPNARLKRSMMARAFCYAMIICGTGLLIAWSPLARPENAQSQIPMLMQLDQPSDHIDPTAFMLPDAESHQSSIDLHAAMPDLSQITSVEPERSNSNPVTYDGRPLRAVKTIRMLVTSYSPDARSCGKWADGITASGYSVWTNAGKLVAADTHLLPFGSILTIPGYNNSKPVPVLDRGGKIKGKRLDVLYPTHAIARRWGVQKLDVIVWEYAD